MNDAVTYGSGTCKFSTQFATVQCYFNLYIAVRRRNLEIDIQIAYLTTWLLRQEAQLMLTNTRDALRGQSRSPNIVPFHMLGICTVTFSLRCAQFIRYSTSKNVVALKPGSEVIQVH